MTRRLSSSTLEIWVPKEAYLPISIAVGTAIGVAIDQLGVGIAVGVAIGVALYSRKNKK
jgi:hypothetical protein